MKDNNRNYFKCTAVLLKTVYVDAKVKNNDKVKAHSDYKCSIEISQD